MSQYRVLAPIGNSIIPKEVMTEEEVRNLAVEMTDNIAEKEIWKEKAQKDEIEEVINWLTQMGFTISKI